MSMFNCMVCNNEVESINDGGCALMMAFCVGNNTNLSNNAFCEDCAKKLVYPHFRAFSLAVGLTILGMEENE